MPLCKYIIHAKTIAVCEKILVIIELHVNKIFFAIREDIVMLRKTAMLMIAVVLLVSSSWADEPEVTPSESEPELTQEVVSADSEPEQPDELTLRENAVNAKAAELEALAETLRTREESLREQETNFAPRAAALAKMKRENNATSAILTGRETQLAQRENALMERERTISWRELVFAQESQKFTAATEALAGREADLAKRETDLAGRESELNAKIAAKEAADKLTEREAELVKRETALTEREATGNRLSALEAELSDKDSALKAREEAVTSREENVKAQEEKLAGESKGVASHEEALSKKEAELTARESELEKKNQKLAEDSAALTSRESALISREAEATRKASEVAEMETLIRELPAFDPNNSTEAAMILTYNIPAERRRDLIAMQRAAYQKYSSNRITQAFEDYVAAAEAEPNANYLAAYWAGLAAERLRNRREDALTWANRALEINPNYRPAQELKRRLESSRPANAQQRRRTR